MIIRILNKIRSIYSDQLRIENYASIGKNCSIDPSVILSSNGKGVFFQGHNYIGRNVELGALASIKIGQHTSIQDRCIILGDVEIGAYCLFGPNVYVSSGKHYYDVKPFWNIKDQDDFIREDQILVKEHSKKVTIGEDCWIGINSVILQGITIGKGCVIGSNSVVTRDISPYSIVAGSPAKLIKNRIDFFSVSEIDAFNDQHLPYFYKGFFTLQEDLKKDRKLGGIATTSEFELAMFLASAKYLIIELINISGSDLILEYMGQKIGINKGDSSAYQFDVTEGRKSHSFYIQSSGKCSKLLIIKNIKLI